MNTCGGCTECCKIMPVRELDKKGWEPCPHMRHVLHAQGPGCGIYERRPRSCQHWHCMWLKSDDWDATMRPDRLGIVVDEDADLIRINGEDRPAAQIWVGAGHDDDFRLEPVRAIIAALLDKGLAVLWRLPGGTHARVLAKAVDGPAGGLPDEEGDRIGVSAIFAADSVGRLGPERHRMRRVDEIMRDRRK